MARFLNLMPVISGTCQFSPVPQRSVILYRYIRVYFRQKSICIHKIKYIARLQTYICRQVNRLRKYDKKLKRPVTVVALKR